MEICVLNIYVLIANTWEASPVYANAFISMMNNWGKEYLLFLTYNHLPIIIQNSYIIFFSECKLQLFI